ELRGAADHAEQVGVDEEVLAELAVGRDAERAQPAQARLDRLGPGGPPQERGGVGPARRLNGRGGEPAGARGGPRRGDPGGGGGWPGTGWGARKGLSVPTSRRSAGTRAAAARSSGALGKVTLPAKEIQ